jgi:hypothetical protein
MIGRMELAGVSWWFSRYSEMWEMMGSKEVPPPPIRRKDVAVGESYVYSRTVDGPRVCVKNRAEVSTDLIRGPLPLSFQQRGYDNMVRYMLGW